MKNYPKSIGLALFAMSLLFSLTISCSKDEIITDPPINEPLMPTVTSKAVSSITHNSASSGGTVTSNGGAAINESGVCWSTNANPHLANYSTSQGPNETTYNSAMVGLSPSTTYYVRAYVITSAGIGYGGIISFTTPPAP